MTDEAHADSCVYRRLKSDERLAEGDELCSGGEWLHVGEGNDRLCGPNLAVRRKIRPTPVPGWRFADDGEQVLHRMDVATRIALYPPFIARSTWFGAVTPWPEDPRLSTKTREEREREAWDRCAEDPSVAACVAAGDNKHTFVDGSDGDLSPEDLQILRDALNHRLRELGVEP